MPYPIELVARLQRQALSFGREDTARPYTTSLVLGPDGGVQGYDHGNELRWRYHDGCIEFLNAGGLVTTRFEEVMEDSASRLALRGLARTSGDLRLNHVLSGRGWAPIIAELRQELYSGIDPYGAAQPKYVDAGYPHSNLARVPEVADAVLQTLAPRFWLEIGSMLGGSALVTADAIRRLGLRTGLVAIDPFCGDVNMWAWEHGLRQDGMWRFLHLEDGQPTIYRRFLANVVAAGHQDTILPITATSIVGIRLLARLHREQRIGALPEVIYLDSAHEAGETLLELKAAWTLLPEGGVLMGDDWDWPAVHDDVLAFAATIAPNPATQALLAARLPGTTVEGGVLLYRRQWLLAK